MFFEGPEKKLEITSKSVDFLSFPDDYWVDLVDQCGALILNEIRNSTTRAFLLSESSLFVWKNKILMITCGQTQLIKSAKMIIEKVGLDKIESFFFERKNEYFPEYQKSFALGDFKDLKEILKGGGSYRFGNKDDHHLYLFEYGKGDAKAPLEQTLEVLIYGICDEITEMFLNNTAEDRKRIEEIIVSLFPGFELDHHWFMPCGYSMNALNLDSYATIHVTPEKQQSYISFEMNNVTRADVDKWIKNIDNFFGPRSLDIIYYDNMDETPLEIDWQGMLLRQKNYAVIGAEFGVSYYHWENPKVELLPPVTLDI